MSKFVIILAIAVTVVCITASPSSDFSIPVPEPPAAPAILDDIIKPVAPAVPEDVASADDIKSLKGDKNTHESGSYQSSKSSTVEINGKKITKHSGHKVTNKDGKVTDEKY